MLLSLDLSYRYTTQKHNIYLALADEDVLHRRGCPFREDRDSVTSRSFPSHLHLIMEGAEIYKKVFCVYMRLTP